MGGDADCQGKIDPEIEGSHVFRRKYAGKELASQYENIYQCAGIKLAGIESKVVSKPGKRVGKQQVHPQDQGSRAAEDRAHAYEKVPNILVKAFPVPGVLDRTQDSVSGFQVDQLEILDLVPEQNTHQQVAELVDRGAYPGGQHDAFPAEHPLDVEVGPVSDNAEDQAYEDQEACDVEGFEQA